jgi:hypothetical protein
MQLKEFEDFRRLAKNRRESVAWPEKQEQGRKRL